MASRKTPVDQLEKTIRETLHEYAQDIETHVDEAVKEVAKAGAKAVRQAAKRSFGGSGAYAKGWASKVVKGKHGAQGIIYNKDLPSLPHLLEHSHLTRNGKRTKGKIHIKPVEDAIIKEFEKVIIQGV